MKAAKTKKRPTPKPKPSNKTSDAGRPEDEFLLTRHTTCRDELASIPIDCVASIAASMTSLTSHEAVRRAYELLDIAAFVKGRLKDRMDHEEAIASHLWAVTHAPLKDLDKDMPLDISKIGKYEKCQTLPLKEILDSFWVAGASGDVGIKTAADKEMRIRRWLQDRFKYDVATAIDEVKKYKINGVPKELYLDMRFNIRWWWRERVRLDNVDRGADGGKATASKRGSVTSNKDKRLGSKTCLMEAMNNLPSD
jgi:hypothetical protein